MRLHFNDLPRPLRERFVAATRTGDPLMIASVFEGNDTNFYYLALFVLSGVLLVVTALVLGGGGLLLPGFILAQLVVATLVFTLVATLVGQKRFPLPPYRTGTFVFGPWILTTSWGDLDLAPLSEVARADTVHLHTQNGSYISSRMTLKSADGRVLAVLGATSQEQAQKIVAAIEEMKVRYGAASSARDAAAAAALDPFFGLGAPQPAAPGDGPTVVARPPRYTMALWGAGAGASLLVTLVCGSIGSCVKSAKISAEVSGHVAAKKGASKAKYDEALAGFKAHSASPAASKFMAAAFDKMIDEGNPALLVRFRMPSASALSKVDADAPRGAVPVGPTYEQAMARKKPEVVSTLSVALDKALPYQAPGEPLLMVSEATSDSVLRDSPRIEIELDVRAARDAYKAAGHPKPYATVSTRFHVVASVPGSSDKLTADIDVPAPPTDFVAKHYEASNDVYIQGSLHGYAWEQLAPKLKALFVR